MKLASRDRLQVTEDSDGDEREPSYSGGSDDEAQASSTYDPSTDDVVTFPAISKRKALRVKKLTKKEVREKRRLKTTRVKLALVKPDITTDKEKERVLRRMATKGVVQLFNAVSDRQKTMSDELKKKLTMKERRLVKAKLSGRNFDVNKFADSNEKDPKSELKEEDDEMDFGEDSVDANNYSDED